MQQRNGNRLKKILASGEYAFGPNVQLTCPWLVELIGSCGFEFVLLDGEHGGAFENLGTLIAAADCAGITSLVRVPSHDRGWIIRALEYGAGGVQVPMVNTREQAEQLVNETKFAPLGSRGFSNVSRSAGFGAGDPRDVATVANERTLLVLQLETAEAVANAGEIAAIPGVDMLFLGPGDLAQSLGLPGDPRSESVVSALKEVVRTVDGRVPLSTSAFSQEDVRMWSELGIRCFLTSSMHPMRRAFAGMYSELRSGRAPAGT